MNYSIQPGGSVKPPAPWPSQQAATWASRLGALLELGFILSCFILGVGRLFVGKGGGGGGGEMGKAAGRLRVGDLECCHVTGVGQDKDHLYDYRVLSLAWRMEVVGPH